MSVFGIFIKSLFSLGLVVLGACYVWLLFTKGIAIQWYTTGGMISALIISLIIADSAFLFYCSERYATATSVFDLRIVEAKSSSH